MVDVVVAGNHWNECDAKCRAFVEENPGAEYVPPYEHEEIFEGHSSLVEEVSVQLEELGLDTRAPTAWVASVGGGGLISGVMRGLEKLGLESCARLVGVETRGCHSWSLKMRQKAPRLEEIASAAKSLGALEVCEDSVRWRGLRDWRSVVVEDREAARGSIALVDHHRLLTELACGCAVRTVADCAVDGIEVFGPGGPIEAVDLKVLWEGVDRVVVVVCGGNSVDLDAVMRWKSEIPGANS